MTAVDLSRVGLDQTRFTARRLGVKVQTVASDIHRFDFGHNRWDLILLIDFPFAYQKLLPRIRDGLRPGGWVLIEAVSDREREEMQRAHDPHGKLPYIFMCRADLDHAFGGFRDAVGWARVDDPLSGAEAIRCGNGPAVARSGETRRSGAAGPFPHADVCWRNCV